MKTISFIVPTIGRPSLTDTILSIDLWPGDQLIVVPDVPPSGNWGNPQRNEGIDRAQGDYLAFIDDDDIYLEGHRQIMEQAIATHPGKAFLFKMRYPSGYTLWDEPILEPGNVGSPMILCPNTEEFISDWPGKRNMADFLFINHWPKDRIIWRKEVIAQLGHDDMGGVSHA